MVRYSRYELSDDHESTTIEIVNLSQFIHISVHLYLYGLIVIAVWTRALWCEREREQDARLRLYDGAEGTAQRPPNAASPEYMAARGPNATAAPVAMKKCQNFGKLFHQPNAAFLKNSATEKSSFLF